jgi:hypothetical protein
MRTKVRLLVPSLVAVLPLIVQAHPGHDMPGASHWHASDAWGWALALALVAGGIWWARRP